MNVLVAVGDRGLAEEIATGLMRHAIMADCVCDGLNALECVTVSDYDVVVLDRHLPAIGGDVVCTHVVDSGNAARVLLLTTDSEHATEWWLGADDHLNRPFTIAKLVARVRALGAAQHHDVSFDPQDPWPDQKTANGEKGASPDQPCSVLPLAAPDVSARRSPVWPARRHSRPQADARFPEGITAI